MQGLNFVAGLLLLVVKDEEKTFGLLNMLINNILPGISPLALAFVNTSVII